MTPGISQRPGSFAVFEISRFTWKVELKKMAARVGLKEKDRIPVRALLHQMGVEAPPDEELLLTVDVGRDKYVVAWRV